MTLTRMWHDCRVPLRSSLPPQAVKAALLVGAAHAESIATTLSLEQKRA